MIHQSTAATNILLTCLAFNLAVLTPVWDYFYLKRWKRSTDPDKKIGLYRMTLAWLWIMTAAAWLLVPLQTLFHIHLDNAPAVSKLQGPFATGILIGVLGGIVAGTVIHVVQIRRHPEARTKLQRQLEKASIYLPQTARERRWFVAVAVSAGICEEILYRGFLIHYLYNLTWHVGFWVAFAVSCVAFGLAHVYQGLFGIGQTAAMGFLFGVLFVATGSLLTPILLHILIDLRVLLIVPKNSDASGGLSSADAS